MAFQMCDGYELGMAGPYRATAGTFSIQQTTKKNGGSALKVNPASGATGFISYGGINTNGFGSDDFLTQAYCGFWFRFASLPTAVSGVCSATAYDGASYLTKLWLNTDGTLKLTKADGSDIASGATVLSANTWYYVSLRSQKGASGAYDLYINDTVELTGTANNGTKNWGWWNVGRDDTAACAIEFYYDDFVMDTAALPTSDTKVLPLRPAGNSASNTGFSASAGEKWACVDDTAIDDDTTHIRSTAADAYSATHGGCSAAGIAGTIVGAVACFAVRSESGAPGFKVGLYQGANYITSTAYNGIDLYRTISKAYAADPVTSIAWTTSGLDASELLVTKTGTDAGRVTNMVLQVACKPPTVIPDIPLKWVGGLSAGIAGCASSGNRATRSSGSAGTNSSGNG